VRFYRDVLGLAVAARLTFGEERIAFLSAGDGWVELLEDGGAARGSGVVDHVALRVQELDALMARLREAGVRLLDEAPLEVEQLRARIAFCEGPDGERIELIERR
jgi:lactoylglutathione lyase